MRAFDRSAPASVRRVSFVILVAALLGAPVLRAEDPGPPVVRANPLPDTPSARTIASAGAPAAFGDFGQRLNAARSAALLRGAPVPHPAAQPAVLHPAPLAARIGRDVTVVMRPGVGTPMQIRGAALEEGAAVAAMSGDDVSLATARAFLQANRSVIGLNEPDNELAVRQRVVDELGLTHLKFEQRFRGLPVWPAELIVHLDRQGHVYLMDGAYVRTPKLSTIRPVVPTLEAGARARATVGGGATSSAPELLVYASMTRAPRLAWRVNVGGQTEQAASVLIDAMNGAVLASIPLAMTENVTGSGQDLFGQTVQLNVWHSASGYEMINTSKSMFRSGCNVDDPKQNCGAIYVLDVSNTPPGAKPDLSKATGGLVVSSSSSSWNPRDAVSAATNFAKVFDYYQQRHNRNSIDGNGGNILAITRFGAGFQNAFWLDGFEGMVFGDADVYAGSLDVIGHEMTHGVISKTAKLIYQDQAGALNEALADIFGEMVENFAQGSNDWVVGTRLARPVRNMQNPGQFGNPSTMAQYDNSPSDHGGVHKNSGIIDYAYYLLAQGETGAIGRSDAERIFYRALTTHLTANSQFLDARLAVIQSADELFGSGSNQSQRTGQAFDAVQVLPATPPPPPPTAPPVSASDSVLFLARSQSDLLLSRRETGKDPAQGNYLFSRPASQEKIAVSGDGTLAFFVTADNDACFVNTDGTGTPTCLGLPGQISSVAMSRDKNVYAFVVQSGGERQNVILYIDLAHNTSATFDLVAPATDAGTVGTVLYADTLDFTANRRFLLYDAFNVVKLSGGQGTVGLWSVSAIDLDAGQTYSIVSPVPGLDVFNPVVARTSDSFITFEANHQSDGKVDIYAENFMTGALKQVVVNVGSGPAAPVFTGDDRGIVYSYPDSSASTGRSLGLEAVASDRLTPQGSPQKYLFDGDYPIIYRRGAYSGPVANCVQNATTLCLSSSRFQVTATFTTTAGQQGIAQAVKLTPDTGYFTFFDPANVEVVVKVLNTCSFSPSLWVFAGGLTNVATVITVTDTLTGVSKTYANAQNTPFAPIQDTNAFTTCSASTIASAASEHAAIDERALAQSNLEEVERIAAAHSVASPNDVASATACVQDAQTLCLSNSRYQVRTTWRTPSGTTGTGKAVRLTADTGYFWFFDQNNVEMVVKVLNTCSFSPKSWVFAGGLTNVQVTMTVTDTNNGSVKTYNNPLNTSFQPIQDTGAFACP